MATASSNIQASSQYCSCCHAHVYTRIKAVYSSCARSFRLHSVLFCWFYADF